jgi:SAM-dependent methyltransferase
MSGGAGEVTISFDDGVAYECFMGRWSRAAGTLFLDWVAPPKNGRWLEIGCGTGAFTELVLCAYSPTIVVATDPATHQIEIAIRRLANDRVNFRVAGAHLLPYADDSFDVIAAALVLNFIPDRKRALNEMRRVGRSGATVAAYVWDFAAGQAPNSCLAHELARIGIDVPGAPGMSGSTLDALSSSLDAAGFIDVIATSFEVTIKFSNFDEFWQSQTPGFSPLTKLVAALPLDRRQNLMASVQSRVVGPGGVILHRARANAVKARIP